MPVLLHGLQKRPNGADCEKKEKSHKGATLLILRNVLLVHIWEWSRKVLEVLYVWFGRKVLMVLIWNRKGTIRTFLPNQNWRCFLHHEDFSHFLGWKLQSQFLGWKNALTLHLIGSDGFPFHKDSKYGPNSKNMKSTKRTFLQTTADLSLPNHSTAFCSHYGSRGHSTFIERLTWFHSGGSWPYTKA